MSGFITCSCSSLIHGTGLNACSMGLCEPASLCSLGAGTADASPQGLHTCCWPSSSNGWAGVLRHSRGGRPPLSHHHSQTPWATSQNRPGSLLAITRILTPEFSTETYALEWRGASPDLEYSPQASRNIHALSGRLDDAACEVLLLTFIDVHEGRQLCDHK